MKVLQLIALTALVSSCVAASAADPSGLAKTKSDVDVLSRVLADHEQTNRSLRRYDLEGLDSVNSNREERNSITMVDDVVTKASGLVDDVMGKTDDVVGKAGQFGKVPTKLRDVATKNMDKIKEMTARSALVKTLTGRYDYAEKLSLSALKQLDDIEKVRAVDIKKGIKGSKETPDGMRRVIEPFEGMKVAPKKFLESHVGRADQRYGKDGSRLLSANVVMRLNDKGEKQILLISSSNPKKGDFLLPKGGWDKGEDVKKAALREVIEEGGVGGQLAHGLGKLRFAEGNNKYTYQAFLMRSSTVYDDWAESIRYRLWVSMDDAMEILKGRPKMAEVVNRAKRVDDRIVAGELPALNPKLSQVKLDLN
ncbi:NUDIX domain-containing protein [Phytophthora infestans]|uniref:NUDIX domain-containing protein n=1 Tax=Phytophthora infestans TaxID=4787 RepID=A0A833SV90_PHYIN|nr:NUDIX domain-containing protein [Phytophthora infestans]KAF4142332.1 NUDIX domain-containing protein [Phytophthora infestans]